MAKVATLDIVKHDGEVYVKEARTAEVGEKIIVVDDGPGTGACDGKFFRKGNIAIARTEEYADFSGNDCVYGHGQWSINTSAYNVLVPLKHGAKVTVEGVEYEVSDLPPSTADLVVVVDAYEIGWVDDYGVYPVYLDNSGVVTFYDNDGDERNLPKWLDDGAILTLIPVAKSNETNESNTKEGDDMTDVIVHEGVKYRKVAREVQEGDKYIVCTTDAFSFLTEGKVYAITNIDEDGDPLFIDDDGDASVVVSENYAVLEQIPQSIDEQIAEAERKLAELKAAKAEQERLKVGDYAVVVGITTNETMFPHEFIIGTVVEVTQCFNDYPDRVRAKSIVGRGSWAVLKKDLRKATPEEVAEAKRKFSEEQAKKAEEAKWSAIGRKVGEYKTGDIVQYANDMSGYDAYVPVLELVGTRINVKTVDYGICTEQPENLRLIVPVEQRFDKGA
ncbi:hypothetical protein [Aneurinibacillus aneurinilyticus]|uniref:Uncharacterized protein n=1 Tax=Aneurinibacillus aneurinilyticus TaxID=1391 RepID=A0A848CWA3_ANEAE|nr:hypothetical protein [Aneurinibacillus aneurinilyticus]NMF00034.1 hypothetical protein [Aneurinibacillus aneurinilyticus]